MLKRKDLPPKIRKWMKRGFLADSVRSRIYPQIAQLAADILIRHLY